MARLAGADLKDPQVAAFRASSPAPWCSGEQWEGQQDPVAAGEGAQHLPDPSLCDVSEGLGRCQEKQNRSDFPRRKEEAGV